MRVVLLKRYKWLRVLKNQGGAKHKGRMWFVVLVVFQTSNPMMTAAPAGNQTELIIISFKHAAKPNNYLKAK